MLSEIIDQKPQFISGDSITLVNNQIKTIGQSYKFKNIKKLHLSYNIIQSLDGIEQFINLQHLSLTDNQIEQLKEIDKISKTLQQLTVLNNPITANPNYEFLIMNILPNLTHLNGEKFNRQKICQLNDLMIQWGDSLFSYLSFSIDHNILQIIEDRQESAINKLLKVMQIYSSQQIKHQIQLNYMELLEHVIKYLSQQFKNNQLKIYLTQAAIQENDLDLERFAQDEQYYQQQLLQTYIKDGFPIYPANKWYLLAFNDFLIFKQKTIDVTARQNEDRIQSFIQTQIIQKQKSQNKLLFEEDNLNQENRKIDEQTKRISKNNKDQQIEQEQFEQDQKRQINFYKKQFKINKGLQLINKVVFGYQLKQFIKQYPKYISERKLSNLTKIRDFIDIMNKYQQKKVQICSQSSQNKTKFYLNSLKYQTIKFSFIKDLIFSVLKAITTQINEKAIYQRDHYLLRNVFNILKPLKFQKKKVQILQFKLLTFKFKGLQREALMLMRIFQKQTKLKRLNNNNQQRKRNTSFQNNYMESIAVEQFRRQRDTLREFNY
ncbi:hypothetical protein pb186bvf_006209 [Paramecium bursaria]